MRSEKVQDVYGRKAMNIKARLRRGPGALCIYTEHYGLFVA